MTEESTSLCCCEVEKVWRKVDKFVNDHRISVECITDHPGFEGVCLNPWVLETVYGYYKQDYGGVEAEPHM